MRIMMQCAGFCALCLLLTGCYLIGDPVAFRTVSLRFLETASKNRATLSVTEPEVIEALRMIDETLVAGGFPRSPNQPGPNDQGMIASYGIGNVYLKSDRLNVTFREFMHWRSRKPVRKVCSVLKDKLSSRYGIARVCIEH